MSLGRGCDRADSCAGSSAVISTVPPSEALCASWIFPCPESSGLDPPRAPSHKTEFRALHARSGVEHLLAVGGPLKLALLLVIARLVNRDRADLKRFGDRHDAEPELVDVLPRQAARRQKCYARSVGGEFHLQELGALNQGIERGFASYSSRTRASRLRRRASDRRGNKQRRER